MTAITSATDTVKLQQDIAKQGVTFTGEDLDKKGKDAQQAAAGRSAVNAALAKSGGRSAVERGGAEDIGVQTVASLGTGIGGSHPDGSARSGKRPQAYRVKAREV